MVEPDRIRVQITSNFHIELLNHHVNLIMQSQLLLDEDQEIIATYWSPLAIEVRRNHLKWLNSAISLSGTMIGIRTKSWQLVVASCIPMALKTVYDCYKGLRLRKHKKLFKKLINLLKEQYDLNRHICDHFQKRTNALAHLNERLNSDFICMLIRKHEKEFAEIAISNILEICLEIQRHLVDISKSLGLEEQAYSFMCTWDIKSFFTSGEKSLFDLFDSFSNYYDTYRLMMSSFLGCIALSFSINIWRDTEKFNDVLYNKIPKLSNVLEKYIIDTKNKFDNLRYCLIEQPVPKRSYYASAAKRSILIQPLSDCIRNIQITYDITRSLQQQLLNNKEPNSGDMKLILEDLLRQNKSASDSIEIVLKMNNIVAQKAEKNQKSIIETSTPAPKSPAKQVMSIHHDDPESEGEDEEYSLSPWESDDENTNANSTDRKANYEDLVTCVTSQRLVIKELREKLRLIREKKHMPLEEENLELLTSTISPIPTPPIARPRRSLTNPKKSIKFEATQGTSTDYDKSVQSSQDVAGIPAPPSIVDFQKLLPEHSEADQNVQGLVATKNLVQTISSIAKSMNRPEETFGSCDESEPEKEIDSEEGN